MALSLVKNHNEYIRMHFDDEKVCMQKTDKTYIVVEIKTCKIIEYSKEDFEKNYDVDALEWMKN